MEGEPTKEIKEDMSHTSIKYDNIRSKEENTIKRKRDETKEIENIQQNSGREHEVTWT